MEVKIVTFVIKGSAQLTVPPDGGTVFMLDLFKRLVLDLFNFNA